MIAEDAIEYTPKLTLMVREGSYAETFAKENGFKYAYFTPVSGITLSEQALTLKKGKSVTLTAEIPVNTRGLIRLECGAEAPMGDVSFERDGQGRWTARVGSGRWTVSYTIN